MLAVASAVLTVAVVVGLVLAGRHMLGGAVPLAAGLAHAGLATLGTLLLALAVFSEPRTVAINAALLCFAVSWVGGLFNLLFRRQGEPAPGFMIVLHAGIAALGLVLLAVGLA